MLSNTALYIPVQISYLSKIDFGVVILPVYQQRRPFTHLRLDLALDINKNEHEN